MDLYSILGQPNSVNTIASPEAAPALDASLHAPNTIPHTAENSLTSRVQAEKTLGTILHSAVERVRYITGASGVALALCENEEDAMVCRASSGPAAPEVGARMYIQSGITAESIRTRQTLRCDRASTDLRVNQESCKALGIESVMVMPLTFGRSVVGMFELFGQHADAFAERDAKTLRATSPQLQSGLRDAVNAGMTLGRIPWAEEEMPAEASVDSFVSAAHETPQADAFTVRLPVAFPIDSFKAIDSFNPIDTFPSMDSTQQPDDSEIENHAVPAFLARLADEARPATRSWSQWFRPQW